MANRGYESTVMPSTRCGINEDDFCIRLAYISGLLWTFLFFGRTNQLMHVKMELICGMCEELCTKNEMPRHRCLNGYKKFYIDGKTHYFYPMLDDGKTILRRCSTAENSEMSEKKENLNSNTPDLLEDDVSRTKTTGSTMIKRSNTKKLSETETHLMILEIQERRPLWDFTLPLDQRNKDLKQKLWEQVSEKLNGKLTPREAQNKFKCLRDTHRKIIQSEQIVKGSTKESNQKWKHYEAMEFLRSSCMIKNSDTNFTHEENIDFDLSADLYLRKDMNDDEDNFEAANVVRKRQRTSSYNEAENVRSVIDNVPDVMCNEDSNNIVLPPPPQPDEVESILHAVGLQLRRIPYVKRMQTLIEIMRLSSTRLEQENINVT